MHRAVFAEIADYIGFGPADALRIAALKPRITSGRRQVIDRFYREILRHPGAREIVSGPEQIERLRLSLLDWLDTLFCGQYGDDYVDKRAAIGRAHVRIGLPQRYMFAALEVVWQELSSIVRMAEGSSAETEAALGSLHKLITLETTIMLETYKGSYSEQIRETERGRVEDRLTRAEQLAEIGQLAASLAHEIKNPLAGISGAIQVIRGGIPQEDARRGVLDEVMRQIGRLDNAIRDLLFYARPRVAQKRPCRLAEVAGRVMPMVRASVDLRRIEIVVDIPSDLPALDADESQLEQLLLNLVQNAIQACGDAGVVQIRGRHDGAGAVELSVIDDGCGMPAHVLERAFEPFFTNKARGTGLGLPICRKIVDAHAGRIVLRSAVGQGTTVLVSLPLGAQSRSEE